MGKVEGILIEYLNTGVTEFYKIGEMRGEDWGPKLLVAVAKCAVDIGSPVICGDDLGKPDSLIKATPIFDMKTAVWDRLEGLVNQRYLQKLAFALDQLTNDLVDEGFDKEDIMDFVSEKVALRMAAVIASKLKA